MAYYTFNKMIYVLLLDLGGGFEDSPHNDFNMWCYQYRIKKMRELTKTDRKMWFGCIRDLGDFHLFTEHLCMFQKHLFLAMPELVLC